MDGIAYDDFGFPVATDTGVRCGNHHTADPVRHANVAAVRECYRRWQEEEDAAEADHAAELAGERALEDAGYWAARAQEDHEAAMGVIPFDVAMADALAHA
ncbi:hypothetical protein OOJ91_12565 [Micromonospora lupini]|uniref:hypothetical protein n=1 Tax=Micromonospora lupini TaxID=285679 RepID=UPI00224E0980|nr:hypothetical protein [Micromonospora lupini]MCX5066713.1 hypothetical protein [Micromonospora lupini]